MIFAISGAHDTGKTTLIEALSDQLDGYRVVDEPYIQLIEEGNYFSQPPTADDYFQQLERSIENVADAQGNLIFDRCPYDFLAYLRACGEKVNSVTDNNEKRFHDAMSKLELVVFLPIESPDRIMEGEFRSLRGDVDGELRSLILDGEFEFELPSIEVTGSVAERTRQVWKSLHE